MKNIIIILTTLFLLFSCSKQLDSTKENEDILRVFDEQSQCYKDMDANSLLNLYINDSTTIAAGPIPNLVVKGWKNIKNIFEEDFKNYKILDYSYSNPQIIIDGDKAWAIVEITSIMIINIQGQDTKMQANFRQVAILKKIDNQWKFALTNMQNFGVTPVL